MYEYFLYSLYIIFFVEDIIHITNYSKNTTMFVRKNLYIEYWIDNIFSNKYCILRIIRYIYYTLGSF